MKRYGQWTGDRAGQEEDPKLCIEEVSDSTGWHYYQCSRKRGHGPHGEHCKQHGKMAAERIKADADRFRE
jgi:hypothetical protein